MQILLSAQEVKGLPKEAMMQLNDLIEVFNYHQTSNAIKDKYYEGDISIDSVNLGLALPESIGKLEIGCAWGAKTVDVLAARSMFDGFVGAEGEDVAELSEIVRANNLIAQYDKTSRDELKHGCSFATLSDDDPSGCRIRFHSARTAAGLWNGAKGRIDCGLAIIDTVRDEKEESVWQPSIINLYLDDATYQLTKNKYIWTATRKPHKLGRPLMEPLAYNATSQKPFGRSRIKKPVRRLIDSYIRTIANATIGLEFSTSPQKFLLGVTDEQYDALINDKFRQYVGSIIAGTVNPDTGEKPTFGQLQQGTLSPHVEMMRILATQFSAATGLTVTDTGVVNDANPTSSDAILAQSQTLVLMAEELNAVNGSALKTIALMALAIKNETSIDNLPDEQKNIMAHFKNPAMPSVAVTADAAIKIASAREGFADTDVFLEMIGFDQADIRRVKAQEQRTRGNQLIADIDGLIDEEGID